MAIRTPGYISLLPVRYGEWLLIMPLFYGTSLPDKKRFVLIPILGIVWSYLLELPAIAAVFMLPGGFRVC